MVLGVSSDSVESHRAFAAKHGLEFRLLVDRDGKVREAYGVPRTLGLIDGRVTYVIDKSGRVRHVFNAQFRPARHVVEALAAVQTLAGIRAS